MTERERFLRYMRFEKVDRIPLMEMGLWDETLDRWHHEGLPKWVTDLRHLEDYLDLDRSFNMNWLPISQETYPPFERELIADQGEVLLMRDERGITFRQQKRFKSIPEFIEFPIKTMANYEKFRERFNGASPGRYAEDFDEDLRFRRLRGEIVGVNFRSLFGFPRNYMGIENWCMAFYDQEDLVVRMIADRLQFAKDVFARAIAAGGIDFIQIWEDMAYKTSSMISPQHVRQYMLPAYRELVAFLRASGVQLLMVDCDGRVDELLPIWLEAGIDGCHPCEIAAGADPVELRRKFGRVPLMGGMDKRAIATGRDGVDGELKRIQPLLKEGAFIPMLDHFVPPDVSWETYVYYVERRRELLDNPYGKLRKYF